MQVPPESCKSKPRWLTFSCSPSSQEGTERSLPSSCLLVLSLLLWGGWAGGFVAAILALDHVRLFTAPRTAAHHAPLEVLHYL